MFGRDFDKKCIIMQFLAVEIDGKSAERSPEAGGRTILKYMRCCRNFDFGEVGSAKSFISITITRRSL
jgi:hypothetical protein